MSAFKKSLLVAGVAMILSNNVFADEGHGIVKFKGEWIISGGKISIFAIK